MTIEPFAAEREWTVDGIPVLRAAVSVPQPIPVKSKASRRFYRYYQTQCRSYLHYCEKLLLPQAKAEYQAALASSTPLPCFQAELTYHITYHEGALLSLYTQSREEGALPGQTHLTRRGDTWDLALGYPIPLSDLFPPRSLWKRRLLAAAAEEMQRREKAGVSRYRPDWAKMLRRHFNPQNFYLTNDGLTFFFPMYALSAASEGIPTFAVPYGKDGLFDLSPQTESTT